MSRADAANAFQRVIMTLRRYEDLYGQIPPSHSLSESGDPLLSWRLLVLHDQLGGEWQEYLNMGWKRARWQLRGHPVESAAHVYSLTDAGSALQRTFADNWKVTKIMALVGSDTAFVRLQEGEKLADMPPDVIVLIEVSNSNCHWMQPCDLSVDSVPEYLGREQGMRIGGNYDDGFFVSFGDGEVWLLDNAVLAADLVKLASIDGAREYDRDAVLGKFVIERFTPCHLKNKAAKRAAQLS